LHQREVSQIFRTVHTLNQFKVDFGSKEGWLEAREILDIFAICVFNAAHVVLEDAITLAEQFPEKLIVQTTRVSGIWAGTHMIIFASGMVPMK